MAIVSYATAFTASRTANFQTLLEIALVHASSDIASEATNVVNHLNRVELAQRVLLNPASMVPAFRDFVALQGVTDVSTDVAFYNAVSSIWNGIAGLTLNGALAS
jgi:hypothetical protein